MAKFSWEAFCGVCSSGYALNTEIDEKPHPNGLFCPECRETGGDIKGILSFKKTINFELKRFFSDLQESDAPVLLAALWAGLNVHAPLDQLTGPEHDRLEYLANKLNRVLTLQRDSDIINA